MFAFRFAHAGPIVLLCAAVTAPVLAQDATGQTNGAPPSSRAPSEFALRSEGDLTVTQSRPFGQFGDNVGFGYGVSGAYLFHLDRAGVLSLRADAGYLKYGGESKNVPLSPTIGGRIQVKVSTNNYVVPVSVGPQLTWPHGPIQPYVNAGIGGQFFYTESSIDDGNDDDLSNISTTNQHDQTLSWIMGGGVYIPVYAKQMTAMLDLGVEYFTGGHAQYLRPGSITDLPNAQIQINPLDSDTHMLLVRIGMTLGMRR